MATRERDRERERRDEYASAVRGAEVNATSGKMAIIVPPDMKLFRVENAGTIKIDLLPYKAGKGNRVAEPGQKYYERTYFIHYGVGPAKENYVCAAETFGKKCAVCDHRNKMRTDPNHDKELEKSLRAKKRQIFLLVDRNNRQAGVQLWEIAHFNFGKALEEIVADKGFQDFYRADEKGYSLE